MQDDNLPPKEPEETTPTAEPAQPVPTEPAVAQPTTETESDADPEPTQEPAPTPQNQVVVGHHGSRKKKWLLVLLVILLALLVAAYWFSTRTAVAPTTSTKSSQTNKPATTAAQPLQLDESKDYGNKYADGIVPVGDGKYSTASAKADTIYTCSGYAQNIQKESGGAGNRGPWFTNNNTAYNLNKKAHVQGSVAWKAEFTNTVSGTTRTITTNDLPSHPTGIFPILATDPAYAYDKNPNKISAQTLTFSLPTNPTYKATPECMGGQVGVMLTGIALFNGFDAGGRDAGAWEVQDSCDGHPQNEGEYHYHTLSSCITDTSVHTVIGYALDGFPITGPKLAANNILTTSDLDACHGISSKYVVDDKTVTGYHYVMTQDFPYSASCFRATATQPPGQKPLPH